MRARRDRSRPTNLRLTQLEDRSVPAVLDVAVLTPPPFDAATSQGFSTQTPSSFLGGAEFLTGPQEGDPLDLARQALATYAGALNLTQADIAGALVTNAYRSNSGAGLYHAYFRQSFNGLEVYNTSVGVHLTADGRVITVNGGFVPGAAAAVAGTVPVATVSAADAVTAAANYFGIPLTSAPVLTSATGSIDARSVVTESELSGAPITTRLVYVNTAGGLRPAWQFNLDVPSPDHWFDVTVDAQTGQVTFFNNWVNNYSATYTALPLPTLDPVSGPRTTTVNPYDVAASPFGWHDDDGLGSFDYTDTRGNNVFAQYDPFSTFGTAFPSSLRPDAGGTLVFDYPLNLVNVPEESVDAAVTNLFYLNNVLHDLHFKYGFDEEAGNFQVTNHSGLGEEDDPVIADALDGASNPPRYFGNNINRNNANFATPPDGFSPQMNMYLWDNATPGRDSSFGTEVVIHEYGHGVSTRLTGGPANSNSLDNVQSGGMGEGWSDFWALMFTQDAADGKLDAYASNTWLNDDPASGPGIRRFPYSFDMSINPLTFDDYNLDRMPFNPFYTPEVHNTGEIWASTLWDLNWLLIDKYGFDKDFSTGYRQNVNGPASAGNKLTLQLVMDGLKLQPANPTFIEARDAILAADVALTGGVNQREIWTAFARRGLGVAAFTNNSNDISVSVSNAVPTTLSRPGIIGVSPAAKTIGGAAPTSITFTFSESMDAASFDPASDVISFSGPGAIDLRSSITGFSWAATNTELRIDFALPSGAVAEGNYQLRLAPSITSPPPTQVSAVDQNLDGIAGGIADQFVANFRYDSQPLTAFLTTSPSAADPSLPGSIIVVFSEPINPLSVSAADLQVSQGTVVRAVAIPSNPNNPNSPVTTVQYDLVGVTATPLYVTLPYGSVTDVFGFPVEEANDSFGRLQIDAIEFPTPLPPYGPLGWEAFGGQVAGTGIEILDFGEIDSYSIVLDAGQSLSIVADQLTSLRAQIRLFDPNGNLIGIATGADSGNSVSVGPIVAPAPGRYVMQITGPSNSTGTYRLRAITGVAIEGETSTPAQTNDTLGTAESINPRIAVQGGPGSTLRGATIAGNVGTTRAGGGPLGGNETTDTYSFTVGANQRGAVGVIRVGGGSLLTVTVRNSTGATIPLDPTPTNFEHSATFTSTVAGTYTVQVTTGGATTPRGTDYAFSVVLNGIMDREGNNTAAQAQALGTLNGNVRGGLTTTDQDWYSFTLTAETDVYLTSLTPGDGPNQPDNFLDPTIELFDSIGDPVGTVGAAADNGAGDGKNALVVAEDLPAGTYRFRVRPSPLTTFPTTGEYIVKLDTTPNPAPVNPSTGGPYTVLEGASLPLNATATDPNGDTLTYTWDLNGDGTYGDATGRNPTVTWAELEALGIDDGPESFTIRVRVSDGTNPPVTSVPSSLQLDNAPPVAFLYIIEPTGPTTYNLVTGKTVNEGDPGVEVVMTDLAAPANPMSTTVQLTAPLDPADLDNSIGLRYSFDLNGDGNFNAADALLGGGDGTYAGSLATPRITVPGSLLADGPGTVVVRGRAIDKDNGIALTAAVTFTILNVNPTLGTLSGSLVNGTGTLTEGTDGRITIAGATDASVVDRTSLRYAFDINNDTFYNAADVTEGRLDINRDGVYNAADDALAGSYGTYAAGLASPTAFIPASRLPDGTATSTALFGYRVLDKNTGVVSATNVSLPVANAPPTGTFEVVVGTDVETNPVVDEGTDVTLRVTAVTDPSLPDRNGPFRYEYDFNYNGVFAADLSVVTNNTSDSAAVPEAGNLDDNRTLVVAVRVFDKDGGFSEYTKTIVVENVAPTATLEADPVTVGTPTIVSLTSADDPSTVDTTAGFFYSFDFNNDGDFTDPGDVLNSASSSASFTFPAPSSPSNPGSTTVRARITDKDGGSFTDTVVAVVNNVQPTANLVVPSVVVEGGTANVQVTGNHPSSAVRAAGFSFEFDFDGNGVFDLTVPRNPSAPVTSFTAPIPAEFLADGLRPLSVRVRVTESFNSLSGEVVTPVQVLNGSPTATFSGPTGDVRVSDRVTFSFAGVTDPSLVDGASLRYSVDLNNDGDFTDDGEIAGSSTATVTTQFRTGGSKVVRGRVADKDGGFTDYLVQVPVIAPSKGGFATGADAGNAPLVQLYDATGNVKFRTNAFDPGTTGGVRVAVADVNGDGVADIVAGTGPGVAAEIRVIDGRDGRLMFSGRPFDNFTGGVFVAAGDMDGDGFAEFVVSPDQGGGARVIVYRGLGFLQTISFLGIDDLKFRGGARVGLADINGDGRSDLLVSAGFMGGPRVAGFEGSGLLTGKTTKLFNDFFAFEEGLRNGAFLTGGDVNGDGFAELIAGAGPGGAPRVTVFDGKTLLSSKPTQVASFFTGNNESRGGVRVAVADIDVDGLADVVTGEADGPRVNIFLGKNLRTGLPGDDIELMPFSTLLNGVFVG